MFKGALIGFLVALLMWLPPLLHFLTGPLGPIVGGFIGGSKARASLAGAVGVGILMSLFMVAPVAGLLAFGSALEDFLPRGVRNALVYVAIAIVLYMGFMGAIGAAIGGHLARRQQAAQDGPTGSP